MTKIHEQLIREKIESIEPFSKNLKGELTIVLSDKIKEQKYQKKIDESVTIQIKEMLKKYSHKDVVEFISKKKIYLKNGLQFLFTNKK